MNGGFRKRVEKTEFMVVDECVRRTLRNAIRQAERETARRSHPALLRSHIGNPPASFAELRNDPVGWPLVKLDVGKRLTRAGTGTRPRRERQIRKSGEKFHTTGLRLAQP